jgi:transcriptional repressor NrdR
MRCPYCQQEDSKVVDSRDVDDSIRRRRECLNAACRGRFTTYERVQAVALFVVKKDGRREEFSREKLLAGLRRACEKRPFASGAVERLAADIEADLYAAGTPEVPSSAVGEIVMDRLRDLDPIAYVRFASVYREFRDIEALRALLDALASGDRPAAAQLPLLDGAEFAPGSPRLQPAAPQHRTRTRRPVRPVQAPVPIGEEPAPREQSRRRRKA